MREPRGRGTVLAKFDLEGAFRTVPVYPDGRRLLGLHWEGRIYICGQGPPLRDQVGSEVSSRCVVMDTDKIRWGGRSPLPG